MPTAPSSPAPLTDLEALVSPYVRELNPYKPGKPIEELRREKGLQRIVKLASNENPCGPSPAGVRAYRALAEGLHRYPDGYGFELKQGIAARWGVAPEQIVLGNGSSEILEMVVRLVAGPGRGVVLASPSFSIYEITARAQGAAITRVPLVGHRVDLEGVKAALDADTALVVLGNPNNPTGTIFGRRQWERFLGELPPRVVVMLDEAYAEYVADPDFAPGRDYLDAGRPVVVVRTFSKCFGLASLRIGYGLAPAPLVDYMNRLRLPFNANGAAQAAAAAALEDADFLARTLAGNHSGRERLYRFFERRHIPYVPSHANFVLARVGAGDRIFEALLEHGVIVRSAASFGLPEWIRVTVGLPEELDLFEKALEEVLAASGAAAR